jgi:hypothetical protein
MNEPSIFIGCLPGEDEVKLVVDGQTVAVFVPEEIAHPKTREAVQNPWGGADKLVFALVNGKGGWTLSHDPIANENGVSFWLRPRATNPENPIRFTLGIEADGD